LRAWQTHLLALGLPLLVAADLGQQNQAPKTRPAGAAQAALPVLSPEDLQLLRELPVLTEWELLRDWDPEEDLPIPVGSAPLRRKEAP
jgi:hypothetical protein